MKLPRVPAGFFHTLPVFGAMFLGATTADGEPMLMFSAENPDKIQGFDGEVEKDRLERFHLECYRADHVLQFGDAPFEGVAAGDRPDFTGTAGGQQLRLDCAALADHHRRPGFRQMDHLRERLIAGGGGRDFSGVAGCLLSVWFGEKLDELPPKRWDDSIIEPLLDAIADCKVDQRRDLPSDPGGSRARLPTGLAAGDRDRQDARRSGRVRGKRPARPH